MTLVLVVSLALGFVIWMQLPDYEKQGGSCANILRAGIERYQQVRATEHNSDKRLSETQRAIEEANALEVPLLERNLIALSTIASIATMIGLLGTTIGMIRGV